MATAEIKAVITAEDRASATVSKFGSSMTKTSAAIGIASAAAGAAVVAFGVQSFQAYAEAEKQSRMLEHAVIDVSHATKEQYQQTSDLADALEKKGVLDADNIRQGLAQLSTFGLSNKAVQALGGSLADLAVNQYGVSASGEQLSDSANMIAKALNGQFGVLEKSGIRFTEAQKAIIEFGTEEQKVAAINEGFQQNLKYTNDIAKDTAEGGFARMQVKLENIKEEFGLVLSEGISPIIDRVDGFLERHPNAGKDAANATKTAFDALIQSIEGAGLIVQYLFIEFNPLYRVIRGFYELDDQIKLLSMYIQTEWQKLINKGVELWLSMQAIWGQIRQAVANAIGGMGASINNLWAAAVGGFNNFRANALNWASDTVNSILNYFREIPSRIASAVSGAGGAGWQAIRTVGRAVGIPGFASGVQNFGGGLALVGERGPEIVNLPRGSDVIPNNQISTTNQTTININVGLMTGSAIERREAAAKMFEDLKDIASMQGQTVAQMIGGA